MKDYLPLRTVDLFEVIETLFSTKKKTFVHIAIDFLLLFHSGIRIFSDRENLEQGVHDLLKGRKEQSTLAQIKLQP